MHIEINLLGSKEVTISQTKKEKKKPGDEYDFDDPMFEKESEEEQLVKLEPVLKEFKIVNPLKPDKASIKKEPKDTNLLESVHAEQNAIYKKIRDGNFNEEDVFFLLIYDLMINNDVEFDKLIDKISELDISKFTNFEFLSQNYENLLYKKSKFIEEFTSIGMTKESYKDDCLIYSDELCFKIFNYIDLLSHIRCFESVYLKRRPFKFNSFKKNVFSEVSSFFDPKAKNLKGLGSVISRFSKKNNLGKYNSFSFNYLE